MGSVPIPLRQTFGVIWFQVNQFNPIQFSVIRHSIRTTACYSITWTIFCMEMYHQCWHKIGSRVYATMQYIQCYASSSSSKPAGATTLASSHDCQRCMDLAQDLKISNQTENDTQDSSFNTSDRSVWWGFRLDETHQGNKISDRPHLWNPNIDSNPDHASACTHLVASGASPSLCKRLWGGSWASALKMPLQPHEIFLSALFFLFVIQHVTYVPCLTCLTESQCNQAHTSPNHHWK
jgi:hypothetical protein